MTTALHLAGPQDFDRLAPMVAAFRAEGAIGTPDEIRRAAIRPLLEGSPHGAVYLIGPARAPIGYLALSFGWSLALGGLDGCIDEFYLRPAVRGRGIGSEVLDSLKKALAGAGVVALHLTVARNDDPAIRLYSRLGFAARAQAMVLTCDLSRGRRGRAEADA